MKTINRTLTYPIVETFHSVQGEGFWTGVNAYFIRLGGCDVYCPWCDQKESWNAKRHPQQSVNDLVQQAKNANPAIVIITGGEPLLHDLTPLTRQLKEYGLRTHLETSGSHPFSGVFDWVTFSPKQYKSPDESIYPQVQELKVVIANEDDLRWAQEQALLVPSHALKYLQSEWNTPSSQQLIFDYVLKHPEWRISLQSHKFLGVR
ncbi:7-carboxy-7-deazaguanine synthase QueE [Aphanothece hegewaldii CCALA 016]|uniref:7-carboxy-7-deazaguanine synthase n=1 Tax=Aphanothece hegewaldii CCALA 016 TaxID=2107694 RepID=A0A2T1M289_9CHRO|nr:7-carboxy-7-deazaguanine synthase QueE [Aphanothece hegewaldii]PSF38878.1 7-carboxy-7-deazaguanine synthase QueE [Aphanothece hegewaldii CCALA 016]